MSRSNNNRKATNISDIRSYANSREIKRILYYLHENPLRCKTNIAHDCIIDIDHVADALLLLKKFKLIEKKQKNSHPHSDGAYQITKEAKKVMFR